MAENGIAFTAGDRRFLAEVIREAQMRTNCRQWEGQIVNDETTLGEVKKEVAEFVASRGWQKGHDPKNLAMGIAVEAAELMEIFQWQHNAAAWDIDQSDEWEHVHEELADVIIYCASLANQLNIDLGTAISEKMHKNAKRFPALPDYQGKWVHK